MMREYDAVIEIVVGEGRSLSQGERKKALGPYDEIYMRDRIKHHKVRLYIRRGTLFILYLSLMVAVYTVFFYPVDNPTSQAWLKGTVVLLTVLSVLGAPFLLTNQGRNASILRMVQKLREVEQQSAAKKSPMASAAKAAESVAESVAEAWRGGAREEKK